VFDGDYFNQFQATEGCLKYRTQEFSVNADRDFPSMTGIPAG